MVVQFISACSLSHHFAEWKLLRKMCEDLLRSVKANNARKAFFWSFIDNSDKSSIFKCRYEGYLHCTIIELERFPKDLWNYEYLANASSWNDTINPNTALQHCLGLPPILYGLTDPMGQKVTLGLYSGGTFWMSTRTLAVLA